MIHHLIKSSILPENVHYGPVCVVQQHTITAKVTVHSILSRVVGYIWHIQLWLSGKNHLSSKA